MLSRARWFWILPLVHVVTARARKKNCLSGSALKHLKEAREARFGQFWAFRVFFFGYVLLNFWCFFDVCFFFVFSLTLSAFWSRRMRCWKLRWWPALRPTCVYSTAANGRRRPDAVNSKHGDVTMWQTFCLCGACCDVFYSEFVSGAQEEVQGNFIGNLIFFWTCNMHIKCTSAKVGKVCCFECRVSCEVLVARQQWRSVAL